MPFAKTFVVCALLLPCLLSAQSTGRISGVVVDVTTEIPPLQSASSEVQTTIDSRSMRELPLNGRNPLELVVLAPGADFTDVGTVANLQADGTMEQQHQFRFEAFNLFNRANFFNPNATVSNVNYGMILAARDPRVIQFGGKLAF